MGRGRAKAKQVKVARQLKYSGGGTDLDRLRAELGVGTDEQGLDGQDAYADLGERYSVAGDDEDDEDEDEEAPDDVEDADDEPVDGYANGRSGPAARVTGTAGT
jgi:hypothetical protein